MRQTAARSTSRSYATRSVGFRRGGFRDSLGGLLGAALLGLAASSAQAAEAPRSGTDLLETVNNQIVNLDTAGLQAQIAEHPDTLLIDVRMAEELATLGGTIKAGVSVNIPRGWLEFRVADTGATADTPIVVYCGINQRSPLAAQRLTELGYRKVMNYADGFFAWRDAGLPVRQADKAPESMLYDLPQQVSDNVWSAIGATQPPTYENSGHNNNLSFIVTDEGVVVVNAGDNALLAQALHEQIRQVTEQPVKYVVLENGQGHAMLGTGYWQAQGAKVIAHVDAAHEIEEYGAEVIQRMRDGRRDKALGTELSMPDETFEDEYIIELGGERIELRMLGPAHSPGDIIVWLPQQKLVISGDMAFHERMLPIFEHTDTAAWIETWPEFEALGAQRVIPGHGGPTDMATVTEYTRDYLTYLRGKVGELIDAGGSLQDAYTIDQSPYAHLDTYEELARLNASRVFEAMEFE